MSFFNDKWRNSSAITKVSLWPMMLGTLLHLICTIILASWDRLFISMGAAQESMAGFRFILFLYLFMFLYNALLTFGIFKVNNAARVLIILMGLGSIVVIAFLIAGMGYLMSYARGTVGDEVVDAAVSAYGASMGFIGSLFTNVIIPLIPQNVLAKIGMYLFIFTATPVLQMLSMLMLLFCKKDFKKRKKDEAQPAVS